MLYFNDLRRIDLPKSDRLLAAGDSVEDVLEEYPSLKREDLQACLDYASKAMGNQFSVLPVV